MTYSELMDILESKKKLQKDLASCLGMTKNGLKYAIENGTLQISKVPDLCSFVGISPNLFFSYENKDGLSQIQNGGVGNTQVMDAASILVLERQLQEKDKQINRLMDLLAK